MPNQLMATCSRHKATVKSFQKDAIIIVMPPHLTPAIAGVASSPRIVRPLHHMFHTVLQDNFAITEWTVFEQKMRL